MGVHIYLSTACYHEQHDKCRKVCKFCSTACFCSCHFNDSRPQGE